MTCDRHHQPDKPPATMLTERGHLMCFDCWVESVSAINILIAAQPIEPADDAEDDPIAWLAQHGQAGSR